MSPWQLYFQAFHRENDSTPMFSNDGFRNREISTVTCFEIKLPTMSPSFTRDYRFTALQNRPKCVEANASVLRCRRQPS